MFITDFHVHSTCSFDASSTMSEMAGAVRARGVHAMCFTDHCDFDMQETMQLGLDSFILPEEMRRQAAEARARAPKDFYIGLGLELGEATHDPERAMGVYAMPELDFILGSLHNLKGMEDFYYLNYENYEQCMELYDAYLDELIELADIPCFDVMAHIGYCQRYMHAAGVEAALDIRRHGDRLDVLLKKLISAGRGVEVNCADLVPGGRDNAMLTTIPTVPVLRRYRELGGEIVTVGSDSHNTRAAGLGVREGQELLRALGFPYVALYRKHIPEFIKI